MIHRHRGNRRYRDYIKAKRKADLIRRGDVGWCYKHFHSLYKGKIHCSCPMCSCKTNIRQNKSRGPVSDVEGYVGWGRRLACTNNRYGKKNYCISDRRKVDCMVEKEKEFEKA